MVIPTSDLKQRFNTRSCSTTANPRKAGRHQNTVIAIKGYDIRHRAQRDEV